MFMIVLALTAALLEPSIPADPSPNPALAAAVPDLAALPHTTIVGYPVTGNSPRGVRESMNRSRPTDTDGERFDGYTSWRYSTRWQTNAQGRCDPASAQVVVAITITLPDLTSRDRLSARERARWDRYLAALALHEGNHARIGLDGAEAMRNAMRGAPNCETMRAASQQVDRMVAEANRAYDGQTRHGRTEGAVYPQ